MGYTFTRFENILGSKNNQYMYHYLRKYCTQSKAKELTEGKRNPSNSIQSYIYVKYWRVRKVINLSKVSQKNLYKLPSISNCALILGISLLHYPWFEGLCGTLQFPFETLLPLPWFQDQTNFLLRQNIPTFERCVWLQIPPVPSKMHQHCSSKLRKKFTNPKIVPFQVMISKPYSESWKDVEKYVYLCIEWRSPSPCNDCKLTCPRKV